MEGSKRKREKKKIFPKEGNGASPGYPSATGRVDGPFLPRSIPVS